MSQLFSNHLDLQYRHGEHWKSPLRTKLYPNIKAALEDQQNYQLPFEIRTEFARKAMTKFLIERSCTAAKPWEKQPSVHYTDVATTAEEQSFPVELEAPRFEQARPCSHWLLPSRRQE